MTAWVEWVQREMRNVASDALVKVSHSYHLASTANRISLGCASTPPRPKRDDC